MILSKFFSFLRSSFVCLICLCVYSASGKNENLTIKIDFPKSQKKKKWIYDDHDKTKNVNEDAKKAKKKNLLFVYNICLNDRWG